MNVNRLARLAGLGLAALLLVLAPSRGVAQSISARRFEITSAGDTTFSFAVQNQGWIKPKLKGIAVDPRQRDAMVARFEVLSVRDGVATALITGATGRVTRDHVAQLNEPPRKWWKNGGTWAGLGLGLLAGLAVGSGM